MQIECLLAVYWLNGRVSGKHLFSVISKINDKIGLTASPGFACSHSLTLPNPSTELKHLNPYLAHCVKI